VGEEDAEEDGIEQHRRGDTQTGELGGPEMSDNRAVGDKEERLGDERPECGDSKPEELAVEPAEHV
jgi:hypothetical protein